MTRSSARRLSRRSLVAGGAATLGSRFVFPAIHVRAQEEQRVLRVLGWPAYFSSSVTAQFRTDNNVRIEVTGIGTPDDTMLFLRAGGVGIYDIVAPSLGLVNPLGESGLLSALDDTLIPNLSGLFPQFQNLAGTSSGDRRFGIPLLWGTLCLAYATVGVETVPSAWADLRGDAYKGKLVMPDDGLGHFWIWNWAQGASDPTRVSRDELQATTSVLIELKKNNAVAFASSVYDGMMRVANGSGGISTIGWQSAPLLTNPDQLALSTAEPQPGNASFCDCIAMVADSHDPELAQQFIDYMISPDTQRTLMNQTRWATVASGAPPMIEPDISALYPYDALDDWLTHAPVRGYPPVTDTGDGVATYLDWVLAWDSVRSAKM